VPSSVYLFVCVCLTVLWQQRRLFGIQFSDDRRSRIGKMWEEAAVTYFTTVSHHLLRHIDNK